MSPFYLLLETHLWHSNKPYRACAPSHCIASKPGAPKEDLSTDATLSCAPAVSLCQQGPWAQTGHQAPARPLPSALQQHSIEL